MRQKLTTAAEVAGMILVTSAAALVAVPLGLLAAGVCLLVVGYVVGDA